MNFDKYICIHVAFVPVKICNISSTTESFSCPFAVNLPLLQVITDLISSLQRFLLLLF